MIIQFCTIIGSFGPVYQDCKDEIEAQKYLELAAKYNSISVDIVIRRLKAGYSVNYSDIGYPIAIQMKPEPRPEPKLVRCNCGHSVPRSQVMSASLGSSCPDCYDRMSN